MQRWEINAPLRGLGIGMLVGLPLSLGTAVATGAGHGSYIPAVLFFPFTMASVFFFDTITMPFTALAVIQFPVYGVLAGFAYWNERLGRCLLAIAITHGVAVVAEFIAMHSGKM